jgi:hypothetical protein
MALIDQTSSARTPSPPVAHLHSRRLQKECESIVHGLPCRGMNDLAIIPTNYGSFDTPAKTSGARCRLTLRCPIALDGEMSGKQEKGFSIARFESGCILITFYAQFGDDRAWAARRRSKLKSMHLSLP